MTCLPDLIPVEHRIIVRDKSNSMKYYYFRGIVYPVGWLDASQPFRIGEVPPEFVQRLKHLCLHGMCLTRGYFRCEECHAREVMIEIDDQSMLLGSAEICVEHEGRIYASPNLIVHYIEAHNYCPPQSFMDAVMTCNLENPISTDAWDSHEIP